MSFYSRNKAKGLVVCPQKSQRQGIQWHYRVNSGPIFLCCPKYGFFRNPFWTRMKRMEPAGECSKPEIRVINCEDRRYPRINIYLPVEYYGIKSCITHTGNISEGGLLIYFPEETEVGQYVRLKLFFSLGSELNTIKVLAEVVWMDNHLSKDRENYPYGLKFIDLSPEDGAKLRNLLTSLSSPLEDES